LLATEFLYDHMQAQPHVRNWTHLLARYKELYLLEVDAEPQNWDRTFRQAVRRCRERLAHDGSTPPM
jgi:hypothetical protein